LLGATAASIIAVSLFRATPQSEAHHKFADEGAIFSVPNSSTLSQVLSSLSCETWGTLGDALTEPHRPGGLPLPRISSSPAVVAAMIIVIAAHFAG
jgi:hypothetical protein